MSNLGGEEWTGRDGIAKLHERVHQGYVPQGPLGVKGWLAAGINNGQIRGGQFTITLRGPGFFPLVLPPGALHELLHELTRICGADDGTMVVVDLQPGCVVLNVELLGQLDAAGTQYAQRFVGLTTSWAQKHGLVLHGDTPVTVQGDRIAAEDAATFYQGRPSTVPCRLSSVCGFCLELKELLDQHVAWCSEARNVGLLVPGMLVQGLIGDAEEDLSGGPAPRFGTHMDQHIELRHAELMLQDRGEVVQLPPLFQLLQPDRYRSEWMGPHSILNSCVASVIAEYGGILQMLLPPKEQEVLSSGYLNNYWNDEAARFVTSVENHVLVAKTVELAEGHMRTVSLRGSRSDRDVHEELVFLFRAAKNEWTQEHTAQISQEDLDYVQSFRSMLWPGLENDQKPPPIPTGQPWSTEDGSGTVRQIGLLRLHLFLTRWTPQAALSIKPGKELGEKHSAACTKRTPKPLPCVQPCLPLWEEVGSHLIRLLKVGQVAAAQQGADERSSRGLLHACLNATSDLLHTCAKLGPLHAALHRDQAEQHRQQASATWPALTPVHTRAQWELQRIAWEHSLAAAAHDL